MKTSVLLKRIVLILGLAVVGGLGFLYLKFPDIGEKKEIKIAHTEAQVKRGKYLVDNVAACMGCHTGDRDIKKLFYPVEKNAGAGSMRFGEDNFGVPGTFYSKNITPAVSGLGNWTDTEIFYAITAGVSKNGNPLFTLMPYTNYSEMDEEDIYSIIAYLRTIPPVENKVEESHANFPVNLILRTIPKAPNLKKRPDTSDKIAYGKYITTFASCIDCHSQRDKGKFVPGMEFAGGVTFSLPTGGKVVSANITPDPKTGIGTWTKEVFIARFKANRLRAKANPNIAPGEFNSVMPWLEYSGMTDQDLGAIFDYLSSLKPVANPVQVFQK
ncbi:cytochrome C [Leptospira gomenensis]|uniref:Cytochrome C n=2 Tax=Leptospira gomenensis TaxID=2484974 RepID=A0A5F1YA34_9LEPT|nr:c-type cytochrome [Leptospira gomenensis]TGK33434.1 cytochrome C [Leptospira gomenensis]TGK45151.1 cytochrome C [Leptospira gomenensis]TGK51104.1 cytochrome C [Leptospira gomenensis]TGK56632.1 cytochrome C [Leptospira gomenensis]